MWLTLSRLIHYEGGNIMTGKSHFKQLEVNIRYGEGLGI